MRCKILMASVLITGLMRVTTVCAESFEYRVKHDHALGTCQGKLILSDQEIRYEASDGKHSRSWPYIDIQKVDVVSPTRLNLRTFESASWKKLAKDRVFEFSVIEGQLTVEHQEFLRSKLSRPIVARLVQQGNVNPVSLPVRHRHRLGGCEGRLQVEEDRLIYSTDHSSDNRAWKLNEIETIGSPDPYHFRVTTYNETFTFDLKSPLSSKLYDALWKKVYRLENKLCTIGIASERRKIIAHGVSRGISQMGESAPEGRRTRRNNLSPLRILSPLPGLGSCMTLTHGWRRGLSSDAPPGLPTMHEKPLYQLQWVPMQVKLWSAAAWRSFTRRNFLQQLDAIPPRRTT